MNQSIKRALISVSDKTHLEMIATKLHKNGVEIISTGGTAKKLKEFGIKYTPIEEVTGSPESFSGRMKTISFQIGSALLFRRDSEADLKDAASLNINPIDLVICNLYPFSQKAKENVDEPELIENIDIGGPTMIRAAAKNFKHVTVLTSIDQYDQFLTEFDNNQCTSFELRKRLAFDAFKLTATYDQNIINELSKRWERSDQEYNPFNLENAKELRYGENPHQKAYFYPYKNTDVESNIGNANILQGKALSYNNLLDVDAAWKVASDVHHQATAQNQHTVAIIKHLNPCGLAIGNSPLSALELAWAGDPISAFGSIICFSAQVDEDIATWFSKKFVEIIIAPSFSDKAKEVFSKKKNLRLIELNLKPEITNEKIIRSVAGGLLIQDEDEGQDKELQTVTKVEFPIEKIPLAKFGIMACKNLKSNAIALVTKSKSNEYWLTGAGMGQPNRLDSLKSLAKPRFDLKENQELSEAVLVSDAFFPFSDSIDVAKECGIQYIIQPGGSIRDKEVIKACDDNNISMIFTGRRHFRH